MGSRGSFIDVNSGDFVFRENGQTYFSIGEKFGVKVLVRPNTSVKAPEYSHTEDRIYAIVQNGELKHLTFYDQNHKQVESIDFGHTHKGLVPHVHYNLNHDTKLPGIPPIKEHLELAKKIRKEFKLK